MGDVSTDDTGELGLEDESKVRLKSLVHPGQSFTYEYDFGDGWLHTSLVEKEMEPDPRFFYPLCIGGARACPPEDCGGPPGLAASSTRKASISTA
ncbi:plasmid pRiA4b ORF-3 family protein [Hyalangium gracile]|uniref:plasmid pRiA4b ORF-3 family protein n=1 Tax=Hyalangium gracile TaxID=394092 RepID=UPI001CCEE78C